MYESQCRLGTSADMAAVHANLLVAPSDGVSSSVVLSVKNKIGAPHQVDGV